MQLFTDCFFVSDIGSPFTAGYLSSSVFAFKALGLCMSSHKGRGSD